MTLSQDQRESFKTAQYTDAELNIRVWQPKAACAGMDSTDFFPDKGGSIRDAQAACLGCEVTRQCLEYALRSNTDFGVWGGVSATERRGIKKLRRQQDSAD